MTAEPIRTDVPASPVPLILFALLILIDAAIALVLMGVIAGSFRGGGIVEGTGWLGAALLLAVVACMAGAIALARRKRMGGAIGLAAVPSVLAALLMGAVVYLLSHMGPHH